MKNSHILLAICFIMALAAFAGGRPAEPTAPAPEDYECEEPECLARKSKKGKLVSVKFRKGDLVSTEDGWIEPRPGWESGGWKKVETNGCKTCHVD